MNLDEQAQSFIEAFQGIYMRFHVRVSPQAYRPSPESIAVLRHLAQSGPLLVSEACAHFNRSQAAMSDIFKRLEARGLVSRQADQGDRRKTLTWLTDQGMQVLRESGKVLAIDQVAQALSELSEDTRRELIESMRKMAEHAVEDL